jgi:hypothetical protein
MVLRLIRDLPGVPGLLATVVPEKLASQELSASVGAPGPHDFAIRFRLRSSCAAKASIAFRPNVRDDAYAPLMGAEREEGATDLGEARSEIFFAGDLDDPNQLEPARENRFLAQAIS